MAGAQVKISGLPSDSSPTVTDFVAVLDTETSLTKQVSLLNMITLFMTSPTIVTPIVTTPPTNIARLTGEISDYTGRTAPTDWLFCDGTAYSRTTYATLFGVICASMGTVTTTIAAPGVLTLTAHALQTGDSVYMTTTGALPTGLSANTLYYAIRTGANTFNLATSRANAYAATAITTTGSQSGTHTLRWCPYGLGDGSTTFNVPDFRGRVIAGNDYMGGTAASRLTNTTLDGGNVGGTGGAQTVNLSHQHSGTTAAMSSLQAGVAMTSGGTNINHLHGFTTDSQLSATQSDVQPTAVANKIIKT